MSLGWTEIILILVVMLLLFGAKRIPEIARALGKASKEFKKARDEFAEEVKEEGSKNNTSSEENESGKK